MDRNAKNFKNGMLDYQNEDSNGREDQEDGLETNSEDAVNLDWWQY